MDTKEYKLFGEMHPCPQDAYGCVSKRLFQLYLAHNLPVDYYGLDFDDYPLRSVKKQIEEYIGNYESMRFHGLGLEIYGTNLGSGKTWGAVHVGKELLKSGYDVWFTTFHEIKSLFEMADGREREFLTKKILSTDLLIIDEIIPAISGRQQEFFAEKLEWVIRRRSNDSLPTITTSNMTPEELLEQYPRVYSLLSAKQERIELDSDHDYRIASAFHDRDTLARNGEKRPYT